MNGKVGPSINYSLTDMRVAKVLARPVIYPAIAAEILLAFQLISTTSKVFDIAIIQTWALTPFGYLL